MNQRYYANSESFTDGFQYRLQPLLNELPIEWPAFPGRTDISMAEFLRHYKFCWEADFNFNKTCAV